MRLKKLIKKLEKEDRSVVVPFGWDDITPFISGALLTVATNVSVGEMLDLLIEAKRDTGRDRNITGRSRLWIRAPLGDVRKFSPQMYRKFLSKPPPFLPIRESFR